MSVALGGLLRRRAYELLADGEWANYEQVMHALMRHVPPGIAVRRAEASRLADHKQRGTIPKDATAPPPRKRPAPAERQVYTGARAIVGEMLQNQRVFETDVPGARGAGLRNPNRRIRMINPPRGVVSGNPVVAQRDQLAAENEQLRDQLDRFVAYLKDIGHADAVDKLSTGPAPLPKSAPGG